MTIFLAVDGDKIGAKLEALLISEKLEEAAAFSCEVESAILKMTKSIEQKHGIIIFAGGDNILAKFDDLEAPKIAVDDLICNLNRIFFEATSRTVSIGLGNRARDAYLALKLAKGGEQGKFVDLSSHGKMTAASPATKP